MEGKEERKRVRMGKRKNGQEEEREGSWDFSAMDIRGRVFYGCKFDSKCYFFLYVFFIIVFVVSFFLLLAEIFIGRF